jgi:hypothetical protein
MTLRRTCLSARLALALVMISAIQMNAQKIELTPFIGYETGAKINTNLGDLRIGDGMDFGGSINLGFGGGRYAEFSYSHMGSDLTFDYSGAEPDESICDLAVDYYSVGAMQEIIPDSKATPYGLFTLGVVNYRPTSGDYISENKMHLSLAGGIKIHASERIGIRLQARLLLPLYFAGTYFSAGTGGAGYGISGGIFGVQGDFTGGLFFVIK